MKKNRGFTLIEIIAALFLISIIGLILVFNIKNLTSNQKDKEYKIAIERIITAADVYINNNGNLKNQIYINHETIMFSIDSLVDQGLLEDKNLINPKTGDEFSGNIEAKVVDQVLKIEYVD